MTGLTVIDVGTATGFFALECAKRGAKVTAIDVLADSPVSALAKALGLKVRFKQKTLLAGNIGVFDLVICGSLLMHLPDPSARYEPCAKSADTASYSRPHVRRK